MIPIRIAVAMVACGRSRIEFFRSNMEFTLVFTPYLCHNGSPDSKTSPDGKRGWSWKASQNITPLSHFPPSRCCLKSGPSGQVMPTGSTTDCSESSTPGVANTTGRCRATAGSPRRRCGAGGDLKNCAIRLRPAGCAGTSYIPASAILAHVEDSRESNQASASAVAASTIRSMLGSAASSR